MNLTFNSKDEQNNAFITVTYRGYWFYIYYRGIRPKRTLAFLMILFFVIKWGAEKSAAACNDANRIGN